MSLTLSADGRFESPHGRVPELAKRGCFCWARHGVPCVTSAVSRSCTQAWCGPVTGQLHSAEQAAPANRPPSRGLPHRVIRLSAMTFAVSTWPTKCLVYNLLPRDSSYGGTH